jgi:hypothetical protein
MNREWLWWVTGYSRMFAVVEGSAVVRPVVRRRLMSDIHSDLERPDTWLSRFTLW